MGCGCGGRGKVRYEVTFAAGVTPQRQTYDSLSEAQAAGAASGQPYSVEAVAA